MQIDLFTILFIQVLIVLCALMQFIEATFFHELGHLYMARKYHYCKAVIRLKYAVKLFNVKDCEVVRNTQNTEEGNTELENSYLPYSDHELVKIARAGTYGACIFVALIGIFAMAIIKVLNITLLRNSLFNTVAEMDIRILLLVTLLYLILNVLKYYRGKGEWPDKEIARNPSGFRIYVKHTLEEKDG